MKRNWRTFIIYTYDQNLIDNIEAWCLLLKDKEDWRIIKDYVLRSVIKINGRQVPVFEYCPYETNKFSLVRFFKKYHIDFKPLKNSTVSKTVRRALEIYYYQLMRADDLDQVCRECSQASTGTSSCPYCQNTTFMDINKLLSKLERTEVPKKTICPRVEADPDELNMAYKNSYKWRKEL